MAIPVGPAQAPMTNTTIGTTATGGTPTEPTGSSKIIQNGPRTMKSASSIAKRRCTSMWNITITMTMIITNPTA